MKKRLLTIMMSLAMILTFMPAIAFAEPIELEAWLKWTEVNIPGNDPVIIAEAECPEGAELSYSWKYLPSNADPDADWEELAETSNKLEFTDGSGYGEGQYMCRVTANIDGNEVTKETDTCDYPEPDIAIADNELSLEESVDIQISKGWPTECVRFVPDEEGEYAFSFVPSDESAEMPTIMCVVFDARGVQRGTCDAQPGEPVNANWLDKKEDAYVAFFYETEDEEVTDTYYATISAVKAGDGGDEGDSEESFEFEGKQYCYSRSESVNEVVKGDKLTISPFEAYTIWYEDNGEEVTVSDPAALFGDKVTYQWIRLNDETGEWDPLECSGASYTKENADESDAGCYECNVIYNDEVLLNLSAEVVIVYSVEINGETYTYSMDSEWGAHVLGEEVTINSGVKFKDSNDVPVEPDSLFSKMEWYKLTEEGGAQKVIVGEGTGYKISKDGSLHIDKVTGQDYGEYICRMYYDDDKYIETPAGLQMGLSDLWVDVGISKLNGVGNPNIIYSHYTDATPGAKISYQWYYRDLDLDDPSYTGADEGDPIDGETAATIKPIKGKEHYYHCDITESMKGYDEVTVGSNLNYITEIPDNYLDLGSQFTDATGGSITASLDFGKEASEYYSFKPDANKVYELTATCTSSTSSSTDPIGVVVYSFDSNGIRVWDEEDECIIELPVTGTAVQVLKFKSGSTADLVYFAPYIPEGGSGTADITLEIKEIGDVPVYHVVEFETDNNEIMPSQLVKDGEKLIPESEPGKEGYSFGGWYTDVGCTAAFDLDTAITADKILYAKWTEDDEGDEPGGPEVEETDAKVSFADNISEEDKEAVSNVTASVQDENLLEAAKAAADEVEVTTEDGLAALQREDLAGGASAEDVSIVIRTYLDMEIQKVNRAEGSDEIKSVTIEITPKVSVIAALDKTSIDIGTNAVVVEEKPITVNKATEVEIRLPEAFADSDVVYVWHNGEEYEASPKDGEPATFVFSTNGFSPFVFSKEHTHKLTEHAGEAPACETAGTSAYWSCSSCGKYFSDANAENEIEEDSWIIEATGHTLVKVAETAKNTEYYKCSKCGKCFSDASGTKEISESSTVINATAKVRASTLPLKTKQKVNAAANLELPAGVSVKSVTSSNKKVLNVSGTSLKGKKKGKATVTCTLSNGTTASYTVKVQSGNVKAKITGVPKSLTLHVGEKYQITADKGYVTCKDKLKYTSSKKKVAKVSKKGLVTAKKKGTAKITVKCGNKKKTIKVKVIP